MRPTLLVLAFFLTSCASTSEAPPLPPRRLEASGLCPTLCRAIDARLADQAWRCGCPEPPPFPCEALIGEESRDPVAVERCLADVEAALARGCDAIELPRSCDRGVLIAGAEPSFVGEGESCNYALCLPGLHCVGDEERACVPGPPASRSACEGPIVLPVFMP